MDMEQKKFNPVGWFEIPVTDLDRAEKFYKEVLGYECERQPEERGITMSWFPMYQDGLGAAGTLVKGEAYTPSKEGIMIYFTAPDIPGTLAKVEANGGKVLQEKMSIGEHGFTGLLEDSEGNLIAIHSMQ